jgi:hypothetical protein
MNFKATRTLSVENGLVFDRCSQKIRQKKEEKRSVLKQQQQQQQQQREKCLVVIVAIIEQVYSLFMFKYTQGMELVDVVPLLACSSDSDTRTSARSIHIDMSFDWRS